MPEQTVKDSPYKISIVTEDISNIDSVRRTFSIRKTFNFLSAQVTTVLREEAHDTYSRKSISVSTQMFTQNFNDIQSAGEIRLMHEKLVELGGTPPDLSAIIPTMDKKPLPLEQRR